MSSVPRRAEFRLEDTGYRTPCWIWQGGRQSMGYGWHPSQELAHRFFWRKHRGEIPEGLSLDHLCRVPLCVNPDHLEPTSHAENCRRGAATILSHEAVAEIRRRYVPYKVTAPRLAQEFGVSVQTIYGVVYGFAWKR